MPPCGVDLRLNIPGYQTDWSHDQGLPVLAMKGAPGLTTRRKLLDALSGGISQIGKVARGHSRPLIPTGDVLPCDAVVRAAHAFW